MNGAVESNLITGHAPVDRVFHWITALAVLLLLASAFLPIVGLKFSWVPLHWITGVVLTAAVLFHLVRASFFQRLRCMWIRVKDFRDVADGRRAAKYTLAQKLMHAAMGIAVMVVTVTGVIMLAKVDTPLWKRPLFKDNPGLATELRQTYARLLRALDSLPAGMRTTAVLVALQGSGLVA